MKTIQLIFLWLTVQAKTLYHWLGGMTVCLILGIPAILLFGDILHIILGKIFILFGHSLHFFYEIFEWIIAHILEEVFHLPKKAAEIIFFWACIVIAISLSWYVSRKAHAAVLKAAAKAEEQWFANAEYPKIMAWMRFSLILSSLSASLVFLA